MPSLQSIVQGRLFPLASQPDRLTYLNSSTVDLYRPLLTSLFLDSNYKKSFAVEEIPFPMRIGLTDENILYWSETLPFQYALFIHIKLDTSLVNTVTNSFGGTVLTFRWLIYNFLAPPLSQ
jgi:hypothetical protein